MDGNERVAMLILSRLIPRKAPKRLLGTKLMGSGRGQRLTQ